VRADVTLQRVGDDAILHDPRDGQAHVINATAAQVWELADGRSLDDLATAFAAPYGLTADDVRADVVELLDHFDRLGLLA
jgi:hypothetical protein